MSENDEYRDADDDFVMDMDWDDVILDEDDDDRDIIHSV